MKVEQHVVDSYDDLFFIDYSKVMNYKKNSTKK